MSFCRSSILNDSTTTFTGGSLEDNKSTEIDSDNHIETMYRQNTVQSSIKFVSKKNVSSPLKLHPKSLKIELGSPRRSSWRSEGSAEFFKASPGSQKVTPNLFQALPIQQKRTQNHKSRVPVTFKGPAAGGEALKIRRTPEGGKRRDRTRTESAESASPGDPAPAAGPSKKHLQNHSKIRP